MPIYTVKIKGSSHQFISDLSNQDAYDRLNRLVKKGVIKGPFAADLLRRALSEQLTPGWWAWIHFLATSKKARQEFGSDAAIRKIEQSQQDVATALQTAFGHQGAIQGVKDALRLSYGQQRAKWEAVLATLEVLPDPEVVQQPKRRLQLIED